MREPIRTDAQIDALPELVPERDVPFVLESIRLVRANVPRGAPLIGFAGAPFTLLCYLVCGKPSKEFAAARAFLYAQPEAAERCCESSRMRWRRTCARRPQAGAQALMMFESWAGLLAPARIPALRAARGGAHDRSGCDSLGVPLIYYANRRRRAARCSRQLDVDVVGIDWRTPLGIARRTLGPSKAVQGNLDPAALFAPPAGAAQPRASACCMRRARSRATSSISATASGRKPIPMPSRGSSMHVHERARDERGRARRAGVPRRTCCDLQGAHLRELRSPSRATSRFEAQPAGAAARAIACRAAARCALMRGDVFEKVGVNVSHVWGRFAAEVPRTRFPGAAEIRRPVRRLRHLAGRAHVQSLCAAVHMNLRYLHTSRAWFGGGSDLTPTFPFDEDTAGFMTRCEHACEAYRPGAYQRIQGVVRPLFLSAASAGAARRRRHLLR